MPGVPRQSIQGKGIQAAADVNHDVRSPETLYRPCARGSLRIAGRNQVRCGHAYTEPSHPGLNEWGLAGEWIDHKQVAVLKSAGGKIVFHFHARDLHLVLGPSEDGKPVHFRVTIDGKDPGENHGVDTDAEGNGVVTGSIRKLYRLVAAKGGCHRPREIRLNIETPGVQAWCASFTFG